MKKLAIVGATGLVGQSVIKVLNEEGLFDRFQIFMIGSSQSAGKVLIFNNKYFTILELDESVFELGLDYAIFLTKEDVSAVWVKKFAEHGIISIDNSSAFRLEKNIPLVVPEINLYEIKAADNIIANPNCSTIQLVVVLDKLMKLGKIKQVVVSSYQSVSGAGKEALFDLLDDTTNVFKCGIKDNLIAQIGRIEANGNCTEENKIINETKKILNLDAEIVATTVRVPISFCHGESVFVKFENETNLGEIKKVLSCDYISVRDDLFYPNKCVGSNLTYVSRLRKPAADSLQFFVIADNLRRGASYNAVKILENISKIKEKF